MSGRSAPVLSRSSEIRRRRDDAAIASQCQSAQLVPGAASSATAPGAPNRTSFSRSGSLVEYSWTASTCTISAALVRLADRPHGTLHPGHDRDDDCAQPSSPFRYGGHMPRSPQNEAVTSGSFSGV